MCCARSFKLCLLVAASMILAGHGAALAQDAASATSLTNTAQAENPCAAYFKAFPQSRLRALLECQNHAEPTAAPYLMSDEARKVYEAYMEKMTKEQKLDSFSKSKNQKQ
jgi:hypothetical protein